jgi:hypothetical protein
MFRRYHDRNEIEGAAVHVTLPGQAVERVIVTLDFVAMKAAVDDSEIDTRDTLAESEFVKEQRADFRRVTAPHLCVEAAPDVDVTNRCVRHGAAL